MSQRIAVIAEPRSQDTPRVSGADLHAWLLVTIALTVGWIVAFEMGLWVATQQSQRPVPCEVLEPVTNTPDGPPASWRAL